MKNHVFFKFIAILLCALSLLGAIGSAGGVLVMTETGLHDRTVEDLYQENLMLFSEMQANDIARYYADNTLGGCSQDMLESYYGRTELYYDNGPFEPDRFGYALLDAEGTVLHSKELDYDGQVTTLTFPITGQYMHLVDTMSATQRAAQMVAQAEAASEGKVAVDRIASEGTPIAQAEIITQDGSSYHCNDDLGVAFHNQDGLMFFRFPMWVVDGRASSLGTVINYLCLWDSSGEVVYQAQDVFGVGVMTWDEETDSVIYQSYFSHDAQKAAPAAETVPATDAAEQPAPETQAETVPETSPETQAETVPETSPETIPETVSQTVPSETVQEETAAQEETSVQETQAETAAAETVPEAQPAALMAEEVPITEETAAPTEEAGETVSAQTVETVPETTAAATVPPTEPTLPEETVPQETVPAETEPVLIAGKPLKEYQINRMTYYHGEEITARYVYVPMPEMTMEFYVAPNALDDSYFYSILEMVQSLQAYLLPVLGICLVTLVLSFLYLCASAGRQPKTAEVRAGGLNRMPLDLYACLVCVGVAGAVVLGVEGGDYFLRRNLLTGCCFVAALAFLSCLLVVGFLFAFAAQLKTPGGFWWRNALVGWCLKGIKYLWDLMIRFAIWLEEKISVRIWPLAVRLVKWAWNWIARTWKWFWNKVHQCAAFAVSTFHRICQLLPLTWQWMIAGCVMVLLVFVTTAGRFDLGMVVSVIFAFGLVLYGAHCFGSLMDATRKMNKSDLDSKVDDKMMVGAFKDFAQDLNDLAGVAIVAAQKQLKSERMKTELITNVSHDIKTPLTSIINYVDLLQKPHTQEEEAQYLEVLDRQSQRLKKLIDDLMDMSKASTGNMAVDVTLVDAVESVNQALGEFADKLERADLTPVFRHSEDTVAMMADGRLVWRVLSNLLGNAVKYAMPGTRLYIDLMTLENKVVISLKNISRDELNVDAEELMERFVRGDDSRNTEGSGLGLNIAKSLMELQKGQLQLLVDGDLFKVTLIFPGM